MCVLPTVSFVTPTVGLAVDIGGFAADARVALDGDFVNVLIDAGHTCGTTMLIVRCEFLQTPACIYSHLRPTVAAFVL